jgi:hypothetical protein
VRLTDKGRRVRALLEQLFARHAQTLAARATLPPTQMDTANGTLRQMERFWSDQIRYIY